MTDIWWSAFTCDGLNIAMLQSTQIVGNDCVQSSEQCGNTVHRSTRSDVSNVSLSFSLDKSFITTKAVCC